MRNEAASVNQIISIDIPAINPRLSMKRNTAQKTAPIMRPYKCYFY